MERDLEDIKHEAYQAGFQTGMTHSQPSPETKQALKDLDEKLRLQSILEADINYIKESIHKIEKRLESKFVSTDRYEALDKRVERTEKTMYWLGTTVIGFMLSAVVNFFILK